MQTVQIVIDPPLLKRLDGAARKRGVSRSALIRRCVEIFLDAEALETLIEADRRGYADHPLSASEAAAFRQLDRAQKRALCGLGAKERW